MRNVVFTGIHGNSSNAYLDDCILSNLIDLSLP